MIKNSLKLTLITGLALFAMYFGAGNLIFPVEVGAHAGNHTPTAMAGMLLTAVALPVLGLMALATSDQGVTGVTSRIGRLPGLALTTFVFLVTGIIYAIPRVAAVSYSLALTPALENLSPNLAHAPLTRVIYMLIFFAGATFLMLRPGKITQIIGVWLTPTLLVMLLILIAGILITQPIDPTPAAETYQTAAFETGLLQGYFTMDANASLLFGALVLDLLRRHGITQRKQVMLGVTGAGLVAGISLAVIYLGLAAVGMRTQHAADASGADILGNSATQILGPYGQLFFSVIVLLACLTTVVGLMSSSLTYFKELLPQVADTQILGVHILISFLLANISLTQILALVSPVNQLLYPILIMLFLVSLLEAAVGRTDSFNLAYKLPVAVAGFIATLTTFKFFGLAGVQAAFEASLGAVSFFHSPEFLWVTPALFALGVGLVADFLRRQ